MVTKLMRLQRGAAMAATIIALPVLGAIIGSAIQLGLVFQAKATLNHAVLQAARVGSVARGDQFRMLDGLARGIMPLFSPNTSSIAAINAAREDAFEDVLLNACLVILNPTEETFFDHKVFVFPEAFIPNEDLHILPTTLGNNTQLPSGRVGNISIQDANILKIHVIYGVPLRIPLIGPIFARALEKSKKFNQPFEKRLLADNRLPVIATATARMQSTFQTSGAITTLEKIRTRTYCDSDKFPAKVNPKLARCLASAFVGDQSLVACAQCAASITTGNRNSKLCRTCSDIVGKVQSCFAQFPDDNN